jgi:hypothetical protein
MDCDALKSFTSKSPKKAFGLKVFLKNDKSKKV